MKNTASKIRRKIATFVATAAFAALIIPAHTLLAERDRAQDFYRGERDQMRERNNQNKKAAMKEMQKQMLVMQRASTTDPGRRQQLTQQINKLQREIDQHLQQAKALKDHANKANHAAKEAESGNERKATRFNKKGPGNFSNSEQPSGEVATNAPEQQGPPGEIPQDAPAKTLEEQQQAQVTNEQDFQQAVAEQKEQMALLTENDVEVPPTEDGEDNQEMLTQIDSKKPEKKKQGPSTSSAQTAANRARRLLKQNGAFSPRVGALSPALLGGKTDYGTKNGVALSKPTKNRPNLPPKVIASNDLMDAVRNLAATFSPSSSTVASSAAVQNSSVSSTPQAATHEPGHEGHNHAPGEHHTEGDEDEPSGPTLAVVMAENHFLILGSTRDYRHRLARAQP